MTHPQEIARIRVYPVTELAAFSQTVVTER